MNDAVSIRTRTASTHVYRQGRFGRHSGSVGQARDRRQAGDGCTRGLDDNGSCSQLVRKHLERIGFYA